VLCRKRAGIAGAGGIGSNVAHLLVRAGIGALVVADSDSVEPANLNRQFYYPDQTGMPKVHALRANLERINPALSFEGIHARLDRRDCCDPFAACDVLVEAFDLEEEKHMLVEAWLERLPGRPVIAASGIAGLGRTDLLRVDRRPGDLIICGDQSSDLSLGTLGARVCIVAAMMANEAVELLLRGPVERVGGDR
jgi:sulfur carrier protein ThiS adenylyltransferase